MKEYAEHYHDERSHQGIGNRIVSGTVRQDEAMTKDERNQFGVFTVHPDGRVTLQMHFLTEQRASPLRIAEPVTLH